MDNNFYTIEEVAKVCRVTYLTVYRWVKNGKIKAYRLGRQHRIKQEDLEGFIKKNVNL